MLSIYRRAQAPSVLFMKLNKANKCLNNCSNGQRIDKWIFDLAINDYHLHIRRFNFLKVAEKHKTFAVYAPVPYIYDHNCTIYSLYLNGLNNFFFFFFLFYQNGNVKSNNKLWYWIWGVGLLILHADSYHDLWTERSMQLMVGKGLMFIPELACNRILSFCFRCFS